MVIADVGGRGLLGDPGAGYCGVDLAFRVRCVRGARSSSGSHYTGDGNHCQMYTAGNQSVGSCEWNVMLPIAAGDPTGTSSPLHWSFDLGV